MHFSVASYDHLKFDKIQFEKKLKIEISAVWKKISTVARSGGSFKPGTNKSNIFIQHSFEMFDGNRMFDDTEVFVWEFIHINLYLRIFIHFSFRNLFLSLQNSFRMRKVLSILLNSSESNTLESTLYLSLLFTEMPYGTGTVYIRLCF